MKKLKVNVSVSLKGIKNKAIFISILYFLFNNFIVLLPLPFSPLITPPPAISTLLSRSMSPFLFLLNLSTLCSPPLSCHPAIYVSVSILLVSSVCSLDCTYKWNQMMHTKHFLFRTMVDNCQLSHPVHVWQWTCWEACGEQLTPHSTGSKCYKEGRQFCFQSPSERLINECQPVDLF